MGYMLASLTIMGGWGASNPVKAYTLPVLVLGILIFDMSYTTVTRFKNKQIASFNDYLSFTGKDHLHHRLEQSGLYQKTDSIFYLFCCCQPGSKRARIEKWQHAGRPAPPAPGHPDLYSDCNPHDKKGKCK